MCVYCESVPVLLTEVLSGGDEFVSETVMSSVPCCLDPLTVVCSFERKIRIKSNSSGVKSITQGSVDSRDIRPRPEEQVCVRQQSSSSRVLRPGVRYVPNE